MPTKPKARPVAISQETAPKVPAKKAPRAKIECKSCGTKPAQAGSDFCPFCDPTDAIAAIAHGTTIAVAESTSESATTAPDAPSDAPSETPDAPTPEPQVLEISGDAQRPGDRFERVARHLIEPNPYQPRRTFDEAKLQELAESIKATRGPLQPPIVREHPDWEPGARYQLIAGERRHRACELAGIDELNVVVRVATDQELAELSIIENDGRVDVSPIDVALAYQRLVQELGVPVVDVAARVGKDSAVISNAIRLLSLPASVQQNVATGEISATHARALCRWKEFPRFVEWYAQVIIENPGSIKARDLERGYKKNVASWNQVGQATEAGIFGSIRWQYEEHVAGWVKEHPKAFVPAFLDGGRPDGGEYICLDVPLLQRLKAEADEAEAARQMQEREGRGLPSAVAKTPEQQREEQKAERRKVLDENKDKRAKLTTISESIFTRVQKHLDEMDEFTKMLGHEEDGVLLGEVILLALQGQLYAKASTEAFRATLARHGVAAKWIDKYLSQTQVEQRDLLAELAKEKGVLFLVNVFGNAISQIRLAESIKVAGEVPASATRLDAVLSDGVPGGLMRAFRGD